MRAALQFAPNEPLQLVRDVEIDDPKPNEVLVRVTHCGVCQSDLGLAEGKLPYPRPLILGHEAAGQVAALGEQVEDLDIGDKVVLSMKAPCGVCQSCLNSQPVLCERASSPLNAKDGKPPVPRAWYRGQPVTRAMRLGAFAEYVLIERSGVVKAPVDIPPVQACLVGCSVQTGMGSVFNVALVRGGETAAVIGMGAVGLSVVGALKLAGTRQIIGVEVNADRRSQALKFGADLVLDPLADDFIRRLSNLSEQYGGFDHVFDVVGTAKTIEQASQMVRKGGTITLIGVPPPSLDLPISAMDVVMRQLTVRGSFLGNSHAQRDMPRYLDLCKSHRFDLESLVTKVRPLEEADAALEDLRRGVGIRTVLAI